MASYPNPPLVTTSEYEASQTSSTSIPLLTAFSPKRVLQKLKTNLLFRSKWAELNGAMGDLGTYIPIILALTLAKDLNLGTTLIFTGIYNIITGALYGVPMPVQPMKSIAAEALSDTDFGVPEIMAAGILTGGIMFFLGVTGLMELVYKLIPLSVVRGIQLAQGLSFALTAVKYNQGCGVLLLFAGIELAMCSRDMNTKEDSFVMLICTTVSMVGSSAALGFLVGMVVYVLLKVRIWTKDKPFSTIWMHKSSEEI
ncbi:putative molybdate transporter 1/2 [Lupinus albus]|uniref:Putative molybdate transporter 1/2 n=1 Tax=Lupinus albus TaxID=3870 RepID=A0A6A4NCM7_LUPAL|nr:putative molybdate transporter 1/2 [Lupinus albus]